MNKNNRYEVSVSVWKIELMLNPAFFLTVDIVILEHYPILFWKDALNKESSSAELPGSHGEFNWVSLHSVPDNQCSLAVVRQMYTVYSMVPGDS